METPDKETPGETPGTQSPTVPRGTLYAVRCTHCGDWHATVQSARDCTLETVEGRQCATFGMSAWARLPDAEARVDVATIAKGLGKLGEHVRFGVDGPTFEEIGKVLT